MPAAHSNALRFLLPLALALIGAVLCLYLVPAEARAVKAHLVSFPDSDAASHALRPWVIGTLCLLPALGALVYCFGCRMDRYIARQFGGIFALCLSALVMVWLLMDLGGVIGDLRNTEHPFRTALVLYAARSPAVLLLLVPYALLLALLYALGRLSADREIVAMLQSGRGLIRISLPVIGFGLFASIFCLGLNYQWAPNAEGRKDPILDKARGIPVTAATNVLYHRAESRRLWMVSQFPENFDKGAPLINVEVTTSNRDNTLRTRLSAASAQWNPADRSWTFTQAQIGRYKAGEPPLFETPEEPVSRKGWLETPSQLIRPGLDATYLSVPELNSWLAANAINGLTVNPAPYLTQWHYRWALPFACLITVLLGTPLAIHFSRRGAGGGVFLAVVLSALMMLVSNIALSLGEARIAPPALAAWLPNLLFGLLGLYLFHRRLSGRTIYQQLKRLLPSEA